jgi:hypothetical protein
VASVGRSRLLRRDTVGAFEARLRWSARWRWLAPALAALVLLAAGAAWFLLARRSDPVDAGVRRDALALAARDDAASLDEAAARLDEALRRAPGSKGAAADRAVVDVLRAAVAVEEGESLAARHAARTAERERLRREQNAGWEEAEREAAAQAQALEREVREREERARALGGAAFDALRGLQRAGGDAPEIARGLALYHAFGGERAGAEKAIRAARSELPADPWLDLAEGWLDSREVDRAARERALVALGSLSAAHPELLRGRFLLARTEAALGRRSEALATLDGILVSNARHEGAQRLRAGLTDPAERPPPDPAAGASPAPAPPGSPAGNTATPPRNRIAQPPRGAPTYPAFGPAAGEGARVPAPEAAAPATPGEGNVGAPSPPPSAPPGGGAGETSSERAPPPAAPPREEPDPVVNGG